MPSNDTMIETGRLPSGHPYARIGTGPRIVLSIPGLSFTADVSKPASIRRWIREGKLRAHKVGTQHVLEGGRPR